MAEMQSTKADITAKILHAFFRDIVKRVGYRLLKIEVGEDEVDYDITVRRGTNAAVFFHIIGDVADFSCMNAGLHAELPFLQNTVSLSDPASKHKIYKILKWWKDAYYIEEKEGIRFLQHIGYPHRKHSYKFYAFSEEWGEGIVAKRVK